MNIETGPDMICPILHYSQTDSSMANAIRKTSAVISHLEIKTSVCLVKGYAYIPGFGIFYSIVESF
jgi:hypothetical protein